MRKPEAKDETESSTRCRRADYLKRLGIGQACGASTTVGKQPSKEEIKLADAQRSPKYLSVTIFDWDDTLFCTNFLAHFDGGAAAKRQLRHVESAAVRLLERATQHGETLVITNAQPGWVETSAARWAPKMLSALERVTVISARGRWGAQYPHEMEQWKLRTFLDVQRALFSGDAIANLVVLGDSEFEMMAAEAMGKEMEHAVVKTVKFRERPTPEELAKQLNLVYERFDQIFLKARSIKASLLRR